MSKDWPDNTVGWFDELGTIWCKDHEPEKYEGELEPILDSDGWVTGPCSYDGCPKWIGESNDG